MSVDFALVTPLSCGRCRVAAIAVFSSSPWGLEGCKSDRPDAAAWCHRCRRVTAETFTRTLRGAHHRQHPAWGPRFVGGYLTFGQCGPSALARPSYMASLPVAAGSQHLTQIARDEAAGSVVPVAQPFRASASSRSPPTSAHGSDRECQWRPGAAVAPWAAACLDRSAARGASSFPPHQPNPAGSAHQPPWPWTASGSAMTEGRASRGGRAE